MKKLIILAALVWSMTMAAQNTPSKLVINESTKTIDLDASTAVKSSSYKNSGYTATFKGKSYPVYETPKGKLFIFMLSKKSGKEYRKYLK